MEQKIKGYRELSEQDIVAINQVKEWGNVFGSILDSARQTGELFGVPVDMKWLSIAVTDLQKGFMELTRAIAKPDFF
jgi:hypothetical protein